jgi:probable HAF family extracellular repeat protein
MVQRLALLLPVAAVSLSLTAGGGVSVAATSQAGCAAGAVKAQVGAERVCLRAGQRCLEPFEAQYRRFGFDCTNGVLSRRSQWIVSDLGSIGLGSVEAINDQGEVIGERGDRFIGGTTYPFVHAFLWQNGKFTDLASSHTYSAVVGINDAGQIIGLWQPQPLAPTPGRHDFVWHDGVRESLGALGAVAINDRGEILANEAIANGVRVVLWQNGVITDLGLDDDYALALGDGGQVVARTNSAPGGTVVWENGVTTDLGPLGGFVAHAINANGQILGQTVTASGKIRAALWDNGVLRDLGSLDGGYSYPRAVNDSGQVIGTSSFARKGAQEHLRAFIWQDGAMRNLGTLGTLDTDSYAIALNDIGHVVGSTGNVAFVWENGHMSDLGTLAKCRSTAAVDINDNDQIVGYCITSTGNKDALMWTPRHNA